VTNGEAGSPGRRDPSLWIPGTELPDRIAALCGLDVCFQRLLHHVIMRLKRNPLNFRPKFPEPLWCAGLGILDGPVSIDWQNWAVEILVQDWIALGEGWEDGVDWREAAKQLGIDAIDANDLLAVHGKTFPIEIFDEAIKKAVAEVWPRLARELGAAPPTWSHEPVATPTKLVPTGLLTLIQAIDYLIDAEVPGLREKISNERREISALPSPVSRAPAPIRPIGRGGGWRPERSTHAKATAQTARDQLRARLEDDLREDLATLATVRERAIARLGQAFCDAVVQAWLLTETTGEKTPIPPTRWSTREAVAAFQSGSYTLITAVSILSGTVVVLAADLDRSLASDGTPKQPKAHEQEAPAPTPESEPVPSQPTDPEFIDLRSEPPKLPRYTINGPFPRAGKEQVDECIKKIAKLDGGRTNRRTIRDWGRHWLRTAKHVDIDMTYLEKRFNDPEHEDRRRPVGNPRNAG
jgi:hypothetical protein